MNTFDAIIIGSGQGGTPLAKKLAQAGLKTAIIEKRFIGGTCINDGCTPTKAMIASAKRAHLIRHSNELGILSGDCSIDFKKILERKNAILHQFRDSTQKGLLETPNLTVIFGEAVFSGDKTLIVSDGNGGVQNCKAERIFINTGLKPSIPQIKGLDKINYYTSTTLMDAEELPSHLIIIGGGYIALEFGQMFRRFGSKVSILEHSPDLLKKEDDDIAQCLRKILEEEGVKIYTDSSVQEINSDEAGAVSMILKSGNSQMMIEGSHVLLATGRVPQTASLHLDKTGVTTNERGFINVDGYLQTSMPGIFAMGDVNGGPAFTHISYNDYLVLLANVLHDAGASTKGRLVPYTIFTDPQLGRIGLTEKEAKSRGINIKVATLPMERVARGIETGETKGMMKAIIDADTNLVIGAAILAAEGGEVMSVLQMAMAGSITYDKIREMVFAHPLYSESLNNLFMSLDK